MGKILAPYNVSGIEVMCRKLFLVEHTQISVLGT